MWAPNPAVERLARGLVAALGYRGVADLDFRRDPGTGAYHLLDFNPGPAPSSGCSPTPGAWTWSAPCTWT